MISLGLLNKSQTWQSRWVAFKNSEAFETDTILILRKIFVHEGSGSALQLCSARRGGLVDELFSILESLELNIEQLHKWVKFGTNFLVWDQGASMETGKSWFSHKNDHYSIERPYDVALVFHWLWFCFNLPKSGATEIRRMRKATTWKITIQYWKGLGPAIFQLHEDQAVP